MLPKILLTLKKKLPAVGDSGKVVMKGVRQEDEGRFQKEKTYTKNYVLLICFKIPFNQLLKQRRKLTTFHVNKPQRAASAQQTRTPERACLVPGMIGFSGFNNKKEDGAKLHATFPSNKRSE